MAELKLTATNVFQRNYKAYKEGYRFIINQGGSRSSKTYSLCQLVIIECLEKPGLIVSIVRRTFPSLRGSVMRDFFKIMISNNIYDPDRHNKSESIYSFPNGSEVMFFSTDSETKLRGREQDIVWINEANELNYDLFAELNQRTKRCVFMDFNPSDLYSYVYDLYKRDNHIVIKSTYLDNPFLLQEQVKEIEHYKVSDIHRWRIMGLGEISTSPEVIFEQLEYFNQFPDNPITTVYGCDWGYKDPTVIVEVKTYDTFDGRVAYIKEILYETHLKPTEIVEKFNQLIKDKSVEIYADHRPEYVDMLLDEGFNIRNAEKDRKAGLMTMKDYRIYLSGDNIIKEFRNYKWKKVEDRVLDVPVDFMDHAIDASRYAIMGIKTMGVTDWRLLFG